MRGGASLPGRLALLGLEGPPLAHAPLGRLPGSGVDSRIVASRDECRVRLTENLVGDFALVVSLDFLFLVVRHVLLAPAGWRPTRPRHPDYTAYGRLGHKEMKKP